MAIIRSTNVYYPINVRDILNADGGKTDNNHATYFKSSANINKWALWKPENHTRLVGRLTLEERKANHCGLTPILNNALLTANMYYQGGTAVDNGVEEVIASQKQWTYNPPRGGESSPYRIGDFTHEDGGSMGGYNTEALPPDKNWGDKQFELSTLENLIITDITDTDGVDGGIYDWNVDTISPLYDRFECKVDIQSWAGIGNTSGIEIPITYITGDRLINGEYWRLGLAVYIPNFNYTGKWILFTSKSVLSSGSTSDFVSKALPSLATNTLGLRHMLNSGFTSFSAVPCLVKNARLGYSSYTIGSGYIKQSYVVLDSSDAQIYSVPSGQGEITISVVDSASILPEVEGVNVVAASPNKKWVLGWRTVATAGESMYTKNVNVLSLIHVDGEITSDSFVSVSYTWYSMSSPTDTSVTQRETSYSKTISAGSKAQMGTIQVDGVVLHSGIEAGFLKDSVKWNSY